MARHVQFHVDIDGPASTPESGWAEDGVIAGWVTLKLKGVPILAGVPIGLNASALSLARTVAADHKAVLSDEDALEADAPLFLCAGNLSNRCGVVAV